MEKQYIIAVDFDGTLVEDKFPEIGEPNWKLIDELRTLRITLKGCGIELKLILWTCRNNTEKGMYLAEAIQWCQNSGLRFNAYNENLPEIKELYGEDTRKVFANMYIDDRAATEHIDGGGIIRSMYREGAL